jgi:hypothetical protein
MVFLSPLYALKNIERVDEGDIQTLNVVILNWLD